MARRKKSNNTLLLAGAVGLGAWYLTQKKPGAVAGIPGIGAIFPNNSLVPERYRGACTPAWVDAALWGGAGLAAGYYGLAGRKLAF
jgi:hypothetical protein